MTVQFLKQAKNLIGISPKEIHKWTIGIQKQCQAVIEDLVSDTEALNFL